MLKERATQFIQKVKLTGGLLAERADVVRSEVLPYQWRALNDQIPGLNRVMRLRIFGLLQERLKANSTACCGKTATWPSGWRQSHTA